MLRPNIEKELPGIQVYISCSDEVFHLLEGHPRTLPYSQLKENENNLAYIRNIQCNLVDHPIEILMEESQIPLRIEVPKPPPIDNRCVIVPEGIIPTHSMTPNQIEQCKQLVMQEGLEPKVDTNFQGAAWVIGVENEYLFAAAAHGIRTTLVPTGLGTNLYKKMFNGEVLGI